MNLVSQWLSNRIRSISLLPQWLLRRSFLRSRFADLAPVDASAKPPQQLTLSACVTVVIPALNEAKRIAQVVAYALADPVTAEVIVVDDSSIDDTVALARLAGARVVTSSMLGKGCSMQDGVGEASCEVLMYLDGDLSGLRDGIITDMCRPLLAHEADFVKARFGRGGGRVTVLTAKPMLHIFFPEIAHFAQPLGGIIAARKSLLQSLRFEDGYGVDVALLIDASLAGARLVEVDIGSLENDSQPLLDLGHMANEVGRVIFSRAKEVGRLNVDQIAAMYESQRQAVATIEYVLTRRKGRQRLLLLDMDGTITPSRFVVELARTSGLEDGLKALLDRPDHDHDDDGDAATRSDRIAKLFRFIHKQKFEQVARALDIRPGVIEFVNQMRRRGFMVGVVSDSYFIAAEIMRRRIFADFAMAHTIQFDSDVCNGLVRLNPAFLPFGADAGKGLCKSNVLRHFQADITPSAAASSSVSSNAMTVQSWVVGDNLNDLALMRLADRAFVIDPKSPVFRDEPAITEIASFTELLELLTEPAPVPQLEQHDFSEEF